MSSPMKNQIVINALENLEQRREVLKEIEVKQEETEENESEEKIDVPDEIEKVENSIRKRSPFTKHFEKVRQELASEQDRDLDFEIFFFFVSTPFCDFFGIL
ncbi:unnamed protein product [Brachionus calyciflorus]|uniref:Uncharacterized protein n=1 Tax=Brachionus calyciflorus TaxID=104777 RepID=A0A814SN34_9BILA|nr:unnamed protein product [Brachionus calyciflorus]